jgi:hypothetical protein
MNFLDLECSVKFLILKLECFCPKTIWSLFEKKFGYHPNCFSIITRMWSLKVVSISTRFRVTQWWWDFELSLIVFQATLPHFDLGWPKYWCNGWIHLHPNAFIVSWQMHGHGDNPVWSKEVLPRGKGLTMK